MNQEDQQEACNGGDQPEVDTGDNMDEDAAAKEKLTASESNNVKFTTVQLDGYDAKNGEAKVDVNIVQTSVGMGKEELMKYANEPFWVRLRMILFVLFWVSWIAMLVGSIVIILLAPRCPPPPRLEWYQKTAIYEVDVGSFKDFDGDGIGDFKGLASKLDYFKKHNIETILLDAFYKTSPDSRGIIDHNEVDNKYGTIADFDALLKEMKEKDIKLVIDFNPNHSGDQHPWFIASENKEEPYENFYVWANSPTGSSDTPPNEWQSVNGGSAWKWSEKRNQFYLHTFAESEPDLNLRDPHVRNELKEILKFWLEKGVDGFKVIGANYLVEDELLRDEPIIRELSVDNPQYKDFDHMYTMDQHENLGLFAEWREVLQNFTISSAIQKILLAEVVGSRNTSIYYGNETNPLADLVTVDLTRLNQNSSAQELISYLDAALVKNNAWPCWMTGHKEMKRLATRVGEMSDGINMIAILAKGTPITYFGDELGITDNIEENLKFDGKDTPFELQKSTPQSVMLWNNDTFAGFTNGTSSLPLHPDYMTINVEAEEADKNSHLKIFTSLLEKRKEKAINFGIQEYPLITPDLFSMIRVLKGNPAYLIAFNMGTNSTIIDFTGTSKYFPDKARLEIRSRNLITGSLSQGDHPKVMLDNIPLGPKEAAVFSFVPQFED